MNRYIDKYLNKYRDRYKDRFLDKYRNRYIDKNKVESNSRNSSIIPENISLIWAYIEIMRRQIYEMQQIDLSIINFGSARK